jgi:hypothetical protein
MIQVDRWDLIARGLTILAYLAIVTSRTHAQEVAVAQVDRSGAGCNRRAGSECRSDHDRSGAGYSAQNYIGHARSLHPGEPPRWDLHAGGGGRRVQELHTAKVVLQVGQNIQINVVLQLGSVSERVGVTGNVGMVETRDNTISSVMDGARVLDLPLNGRQATDLILLTGGSVTAPGGDQTG